MDIKDVSGLDDYLAHLNQIKSSAKRASLRDGEIVRVHPDPRLLAKQFMITLAHQARAGSRDIHNIWTSQVPPHYPPCILPSQELKPLMISHMRLGRHYQGNRTLIRVLTPPNRMTAVMAIIEDEEGTAVLLQLYNQPEEDNVGKEQILQLGDVCIVKDPFFKVTTDGSYSLRVDHVSDIIRLEDTDDRIPLKWRKRVLSLDKSSQEIRKQGNASFQKQNWAEAERLYVDDHNRQ